MEFYRAFLSLRFLRALLCLAATVFVFKEAMLLFETRTGSVLPDPLQDVFGPYNLHWPIFLVTYAPVLCGIFFVARQKTQAENLIYAYCLLQLFRLTTIYLLPLEAPPEMITLWDPIADHLVFGSIVTKDLFFSGHVSTLVLFSFYLSDPRQRKIYRMLAFIDAVLLTAQHVHYTADVVFAPFFAYSAYRLQTGLKRKTQD